MSTLTVICEHLDAASRPSAGG